MRSPRWPPHRPLRSRWTTGDSTCRPSGPFPDRGISQKTHPTVIHPADHATYSPDKMGKATLFESSRLLVGLNALLEPEQTRPSRMPDRTRPTSSSPAPAGSCWRDGMCRCAQAISWSPPRVCRTACGTPLGAPARAGRSWRRHLHLHTIEQFEARPRSPRARSGLLSQPWRSPRRSAPCRAASLLHEGRRTSLSRSRSEISPSRPRPSPTDRARGTGHHRTDCRRGRPGALLVVRPDPLYVRFTKWSRVVRSATISGCSKRSARRVPGRACSWIDDPAQTRALPQDEFKGFDPERVARLFKRARDVTRLLKDDRHHPTSGKDRIDDQQRQAARWK